MKSIDAFLDRVPSPTYNCLDFVREVWLHLCGEDVTEKLSKLVGSFDARKVTISGVKAFTRLSEPVDPCFVVMQRKGTVPHVGIYLHGEILHLRAHGVEYRPLAIAKGPFRIIRYYR